MTLQAKIQSHLRQTARLNVLSGVEICVGTADHKNLDIHWGSKPCQVEFERKAQAQTRTTEPNQLLHAFLQSCRTPFLRPKPLLDLSVVWAPAPIHAPQMPGTNGRRLST